MFPALRFFETHSLFTGVRSLDLPSNYVSMAGLAILILAQKDDLQMGSLLSTGGLGARQEIHRTGVGKLCVVCVWQPSTWGCDSWTEE
jgi:hypothetical protein